MSAIVLNANRQITPPKQQAQRNDYPCNETPDAPHICTLQESPQGQHIQDRPMGNFEVTVLLIAVAVIVAIIFIFKKAIR